MLSLPSLFLVSNRDQRDTDKNGISCFSIYWAYGQNPSKQERKNSKWRITATLMIGTFNHKRTLIIKLK